MAMIDDVPGLIISDNKGKIVDSFALWFHKAFILLTAVQESGTTAQRPTKIIWVGRRYYDTTLNQPIWASAVSGVTVTWRDALGNHV